MSDTIYRPDSNSEPAPEATELPIESRAESSLSVSRLSRSDSVTAQNVAIAISGGASASQPHSPPRPIGSGCASSAC